MIAAEIFKASRKKRFWVQLIGTVIIFPLLSVIVAAFISGRGGGVAPDETIKQVVNQIATPYSMARNGLWLFGFFVYFALLPIVAVVSIFLIGEDRGFKMWKTILVANPNRLQVIAAKFMAGMLLLAGILFGGLLGSLVFGTFSTIVGLSSGFSGDWGSLIAMYFLQWLILTAPLALGFLISWLVASPAITVFGIVLLPAIIEGIIRAWLVAQVGPLSPLSAPLEAARLQETLERVPRFFLTPNINIGSRLLGDDAEKIFGAQANLVLPTLDWSQIGWSVGVSGVYFLLFAGLVIWSFTSRDVQE
jgi:hypothetical protein